MSIQLNWILAAICFYILVWVFIFAWALDDGASFSSSSQTNYKSQQIIYCTGTLPAGLKCIYDPNN